MLSPQVFQLPRLSDTIIKKFSDANFQEMSYEIFKLYYVGDTFLKSELRTIIDKAYSQLSETANIVDVTKIDHISLCPAAPWTNIGI